MKRALVTGATGFVGQALVRRLVGDDWQVFAIVRPSSRPADLAGATTLTCDGTVDSLIRACGQAKPDVVFHLASLFISEHAPKDVRPLIESNLVFGCHLAEAMVKNGAKALVNTGTSWQHFHSDTYRPVNLYAATKQAFEDLLAYYQDVHDLRVINLKLFDNYGPGDPRPKLFAALRKANDQPMDFSGGRQLVDLVYVEDTVEAFVLAAERLLSRKVRRSETFAVSSGRPIPLRRLVALFEKVSGKKLQIRWDARPYRAREVMKPWSAGRRLPGWKPRIPLEKGLSAL